MITKIIRRLKRFWYGLLVSNSLPMLAFALCNRSRVPVNPSYPPVLRERQEKGPRAPRHEPLVDPEWPHVPQVVFQTWKSRTQVPSNYDAWSRSFRHHNPRYECMIWDDLDNREFVAEQFPWFLPFYDRYPKEIFRADAVRYFFLYKFGGLYADMDTECLKPLDPILRTGDAIFGRMGVDKRFEHSIPNAMMASKRLHLIWLLAIALMIEGFRECNSPEEMARRGPETLTGPVLLKNTVDFYTRSTEQVVRNRAQWVIDQVCATNLAPRLSADVKILAPNVWYPVDWTNPFHQAFRRTLAANKMVLTAQQTARLFPDSYLVTYWSHSW
jgi:inositol phosphorylceramide mannosyltransferase catalytic subunit